MPQPHIEVRPVVDKGNMSFGVCLLGSRIARSFGFKGLVIMKLYTREAAEDWVARLKTLKSRSKVRKLLLTHAAWLP